MMGTGLTLFGSGGFAIRQETPQGFVIPALGQRMVALTGGPIANPPM